MIQKRSNLYLNGRIYIQMIKFKFKWINQKLTVHYHPLALVVASTAQSERVLSLPPVQTSTAPSSDM
jgi:hypothetical protein